MAFPQRIVGTRDNFGGDGATTVWRWRDQVVFVLVCGGVLDVFLLIPFPSFLALICVRMEGVSSLFSFWFSSGCKEEDAKLALQMQCSSRCLYGDEGFCVSWPGFSFRVFEFSVLAQGSRIGGGDFLFPFCRL
ncbi:hypothetical protein V8G54_001389 [Vigna mungo]|uniref:Transmembrane protein n=1 Tax=Vigna mungo TaxID=3915 RepID=A0AAQ3P719_VIGMU